VTSIGLLDYGLSNIRSVQKAFEHLDIPTQLINRPEQVTGCDKLILPGVGAFQGGMDGLRAHNLVEPLQQAVAAGMPLLGICLGMQLLFELSEEDGQHTGLGFLPGRVVRFPESELVVPHMGWNQLHRLQDSRLLQKVPASGGYAYFVHSYYCQPTGPAIILMESDYGFPFPAIVGNGQLFGLQFHPEKSQTIGLQLLRNFANL